MNQFYVSMIFFGIILIIFSLVWVVLDKKKVFTFVRHLDEKKQELVEIINDAEQMIEELNKFSDYIVTQIDLKNEELWTNLRKAGDEIKDMNSRTQSVSILINETVADVKKEINSNREMPIAVNWGSPETSIRPQEPFFNYDSDLIIENMNFENAGVNTTAVPKNSMRNTEKVIPINNKCREVLRLSESGFSNLEIAKKLNTGKGEIELILGLGK